MKTSSRGCWKGGRKVVYFEIKKSLLDVTTGKHANENAALVFGCDNTRPDSVEALIDNPLKTYGQLDVFVHNARRMGRFDAVADFGHKMWKGMLAVISTAPYLLTKFAVQRFLQ